MSSETAAVVEESSGILEGAPIVYLILFVNDVAESRAFYERKLGLRVVEADESSAKFDAGLVMLCLNRASDYGITLTSRRDDASDVVFLVDDINAAREALEARGVVFARRHTYEIGLVADFYDPNGHRLMLYQPSREALTWPSSGKIREVWRACGLGGAELIGPSAGPAPERAPDQGPPGLDGKPLIYLFVWADDSAEALAFYKGALGLRELERVHCSNPSCPPEEDIAVVKYDGGGMLLSTHHVHKAPVIDDFGKVYPPRAIDPAQTKGIVPVLYVSDIRSAVEQASRRGVRFPAGIIRSQIGEIAKFEASTGQTYYLYQPSAGAMQWPSGAKIKQILAA